MGATRDLWDGMGWGPSAHFPWDGMGAHHTLSPGMGWDGGPQGTLSLWDGMGGPGHTFSLG